MAALSQDALAKLETKAVAAERLIQLLKLQLGQVRAAQVTPPAIQPSSPILHPQGGAQKAVYSREAEQLRGENSALRAEVEEWKNRLTQAEVERLDTSYLVFALANSSFLHLFFHYSFAVLLTHSVTIYFPRLPAVRPCSVPSPPTPRKRLLLLRRPRRPQRQLLRRRRSRKQRKLPRSRRKRLKRRQRWTLGGWTSGLDISGFKLSAEPETKFCSWWFEYILLLF